MNKTEFLNKVIEQFLLNHSAWTEIVRDKRDLYYAAGRDFPGITFLYVDFSVRPDRFVASHGVGWTTSLDRFNAARAEKASPPIQPRDGSLRRLLSLEDPRDFHHEELRVSTSQLCKPVGGFDLAEDPADEVLAMIAAEVQEVALPYLCLMLLKRHGISMTSAALSGARVD